MMEVLHTALVSSYPKACVEKRAVPREVNISVYCFSNNYIRDVPQESLHMLQSLPNLLH